MFLTVQKGFKKKLIRIHENADNPLDFTTLNNLIKDNFYLLSDPAYLTETGVTLPIEDIIDYVNQFIWHPSFVLHIKDSDVFEQNHSCNDGNNNTLATLCQTNDRHPILSEASILDDIFNNLETSKNLESFLHFQCKSTMELYQKYKCLRNKDRSIISKSIIKQLLDLNPHRMLHRSDFERLATFITEIFPQETPMIYYKKYSNGRLASGKLYDAYTNQRKHLAKEGVIIRRARKNIKDK